MAKYLITHIDLDGKMAGALASYFNKYFNFDEIIYANYGFETKPETLDLITPENTIWITDLSVPESIFVEWKNTLKEIKVWDHHISADGLSKHEECDMDNTRCGTRIFWEDCIRPVVAKDYSEDALEKLDFIVKLTDVYDMWRKSDPLWVAATRLNRVCTLASQKAYEGTAKYFATRFDALLKEDRLQFDSTETEYYTGKEKELNDFILKAKSELKIQRDKKGYAFAVVPTPKSVSMSLAADILFDDIPTLDYMILWNVSFRNAMSLRSRHGVNLTGLHGVFGHESAAGVSGGAKVADPKTVYLRDCMEKLVKGGYCLSWVEPDEEKKEEIQLEEC